jgi:hypothetical protein
MWACLDYAVGAIPVEHLSIALIQAVFVAALLILFLFVDREGGLWRRIRLFLPVIMISLGLFYLLHDIDHHIKRREVIKLLAGHPGAWSWIIVIWTGLPLLYEKRPDGAVRRRAFRCATGLLLIYFTLCMASTGSSIRPSASISQFFFDRGILFVLLVIWLRLTECDPSLRRRSACWILYIMACLVLAALMIVVLDVTGGEELKTRFTEWRFMHDRAAAITGDFPPRRLLFPMLHFNRSAHVMLLSCLLFLTALCSGEGRRNRLHMASLVLCAFSLLLLILTHTRGMIIAASSGLLVWALLYSRRLFIFLVVVGLIVLVFMAPLHRDYLMTAIKPETYKVHEGSLNSMKARILAWQYGGTLIRSYPMTGIGYGTRLMKDLYRRNILIYGDQKLRENLAAGHVMQHLHNVWLETAAESGIPAAVFLFLFCFARWIILFRAWHCSSGWNRRRMAAWISIEVSLLIAGMLFYMLRRNSGMLPWLVWGLILMDAVDVLNSSEQAKQNRGSPQNQSADLRDV